MRFPTLLLVSISLWVAVQSHAVLNTPKPWNPNPSKASPCGGGAAPTVPDAVWTQGSKVGVRWQVVAADGQGNVTATFDPTGAQVFTATAANLVTNFGAAPTVGFYNFTLTVPAITCTGTNGLCSVQFKSSSNWFSCTTVQLIQAGQPPVVIPGPTCQTVTGLNFCSELNGQMVLVQAGQTPANIEAVTASTYNANLYNPQVFANGNDTNCAAAYKTFLCHNDFPYCNTNGACQAVCTNAIQTCQVTQEHAGLYNCAAGPVSCCQNGTLPCAAPTFATFAKPTSAAPTSVTPTSAAAGSSQNVNPTYPTQGGLNSIPNAADKLMVVWVLLALVVVVMSS